MLSEANFLILDEPTNHLDIASKEVLENAINQYSGTVLYVSHDRYFINKTASRILELTNQTMVNYLGNYDYYVEKKPDMEKTILADTSQTGRNSSIFYKSKNESLDNTKENNLKLESEENDDISDGKQIWLMQKEEQARIRKLESSLKQTEDEISKLEARNEEIDNLLILEEVYTNVDKLVKLNKEKKEIEHKLESLLHIWEELAAESI